jgi:hypothetical protein
MTRYEKYNHILKSFQISKNSVFKAKDIVSFDSLEVQAGHFKLNSFFGEHGLLMANLTGQYPNVKIYTHGKRLKNTVLASTKINTAKKWGVLDRIINDLFPTISDISLSKHKRMTNKSVNYSFRVRNFFEYEDFSALLTERLLRRDIYLPLFVNIQLTSSVNNETYLRMLRLPVQFYKIK